MKYVYVGKKHQGGTGGFRIVEKGTDEVSIIITDDGLAAHKNDRDEAFEAACKLAGVNTSLFEDVEWSKDPVFGDLQKTT